MVLASVTALSSHTPWFEVLRWGKTNFSTIQEMTPANCGKLMPACLNMSSIQRDLAEVDLMCSFLLFGKRAISQAMDECLHNSERDAERVLSSELRSVRKL